LTSLQEDKSVFLSFGYEFDSIHQLTAGYFVSSRVKDNCFAAVLFLEETDVTSHYEVGE